MTVLLLALSLAHAGGVPIEEGLVPVTDRDELFALNLQGTDDQTWAYLDNLMLTLDTELDDFLYHFEFSPVLDPFMPMITTLEGDLWLSAILRSERGTEEEEATCSGVAEMQPEIYVGDARELGEGVCGAISVVHSAVKLDLIAETDEDDDPAPTDEAPSAYDGDHIREGWITGMMDGGKKMPTTRLESLHEELGTGECERDLREDFGSMRGAIGWGRGLLAKDRLGWDCTLIVEAQVSTPSGLVWVGHAEHVTGVRFDRRARALRISTKNGLSQGNQRTTVPKDAGSNHWLMRPGPPIAMSLGAGSDAKALKWEAAVGGIDRVGWVCCPPPAD